MGTAIIDQNVVACTRFCIHATTFWSIAAVLSTTGGAKYTLTFQPNEPGNQIGAPGFWSVTMYQQPEKTLVANPIERWSLIQSNATRLMTRPRISITTMDH